MFLTLVEMSLYKMLLYVSSFYYVALRIKNTSLWESYRIFSWQIRENNFQKYLPEDSIQVEAFLNNRGSRYLEIPWIYQN